MDKSLDEYAKEKKINARRGGGGGRRGGRFNGPGRQNAGAGAIQKRRSAGGLSPNKANAVCDLILFSFQTRSKFQYVKQKLIVSILSP